MATDSTGTLGLFWKCKTCHKNGKKAYCTTYTYWSNDNVWQYQGGGKRVNIFIGHSGQNDNGNTNSGNPGDALVLCNYWCGTGYVRGGWPRHHLTSEIIRDILRVDYISSSLT